VFMHSTDETLWRTGRKKGGESATSNRKFAAAMHPNDFIRRERGGEGESSPFVVRRRASSPCNGEEGRG